MSIEENISQYVKQKGIAITVMSKQTGIPYMALYDSIGNGNKKRKLRSRELIDV